MALLKVVSRNRFRISLVAASVALGLVAGIAHGAGRPLPPPCTTPLPPGPIIEQLDGSEQLDRFGHAVAFGDVNGDGIADLIVGAPIGTRAKSGSIDRPGYVRVYNGANLTQPPREFTDPDDNPGGLFGWRVASGDVIGDGSADVVVTALRAETSRSLEDQGSIWIFSGAAGFFNEDYVPPIPIRINGEKATEQLGESLALADIININDDGKAELLAGAWSYDPGAGGTNKNNGIVRLYNVATGEVLFQRIGTARAEGIQDEMGRAVAFGYVDEDATLDLILGAGGGPGYVEVISGADVISGVPVPTPLHLFRGDLSVGNEDQFGRAVAAADRSTNPPLR
jgi:hypothetical protein